MSDDDRRARSASLKLAFLILATSAVSAGVLSLRAQRLQAAHIATGALEDARSLERTIDQARLDIARLSSPERVRRLVDAAGRPMAPLIAAPAQPAPHTEPASGLGSIP